MAGIWSAAAWCEVTRRGDDVTPVLETSRLLLRPVTLDDAPAAQALFAHWDIVRYLRDIVPWPYPADGTYTFYRDVLFPNMEAGKSLGWAVIERASGQFAGLLELCPHDDEDNRGFWIGLPFQQKGYVTEAVTATTDYAFDVLGMTKLRLNNAAANIGSHRIKEKAGATLVEITEGEFVAGTLPKEIWELTPDAWRASPMKRAAPNPSYILR